MSDLFSQLELPAELYGALTKFDCDLRSKSSVLLNSNNDKAVRSWYLDFIRTHYRTEIGRAIGEADLAGVARDLTTLFAQEFERKESHISAFTQFLAVNPVAPNYWKKHYAQNEPHFRALRNLLQNILVFEGQIDRLWGEGSREYFLQLYTFLHNGKKDLILPGKWETIRSELWRLKLPDDFQIKLEKLLVDNQNEFTRCMNVYRDKFNVVLKEDSAAEMVPQLWKVTTAAANDFFYNLLYRLYREQRGGDRPLGSR